MYYLYLNNGEIFEIINAQERFENNNYTLILTIKNNSMLNTIVNLFTGDGALDKITIKDSNDKIIFNSTYYKYFISAENLNLKTYDNEIIIIISSNITSSTPNSDPVVEAITSINETLKQQLNNI